MLNEFSLSKIKTQSDSKLAEQERIDKRKFNCIVLILHHLQEHGYTETCEKLQKEANVSLSKVSAADNVDLLTIIQEFESYYYIKFGKQPKLVSKSGNKPEKTKMATPERKEQRKRLPAIAPALQPIKRETETDLARKGDLEAVGKKSDLDSSGKKTELEAVGKRTELGMTGKRVESIAPAAEPNLEERLLKPLPDYGSELKELAAIISRDIFVENPNVKWDDIAGLRDTKRLAQEAIVLPMRFPQFFTGILQPWKGLLMYGPPGTGKTMLAKAVATECKTTFFNISASSIVSKWRGDSEKLIRVLFELARFHAPSTIFLDELESIMSQRSSEGSEHEGSRRMKTELLIQMDGLAKTDAHVFLLAASNLPWDLDSAMLRRLEKRIFVDLPDLDARKAMLEKWLPHNQTNDGLKVDELDYDQLAQMIEGYSGSDIHLLCREAAMKPLRKLFQMLDIETTQVDHVIRDPVTMHDVLEAMRNTKSTCDPKMRARYAEWADSFGSV
ncbi:katanin p60 subunit A-like 2 [Gorgonomyces haynaldii]|nr:katanin p60 subunit A-like 2 [Gorgonomyces haynaldii]